MFEKALVNFRERKSVIEKKNDARTLKRNIVNEKDDRISQTFMNLDSEINKFQELVSNENNKKNSYEKAINKYRKVFKKKKN